MSYDRPPFWHWPLDRWKLLLALLLGLLLLVIGPRSCQAPGVGTVPAFNAPAPDATLTRGDLGLAAGVAGPGDTIRLFEDDAVLAETVADDEGNWSVAMPALAAGAHALVAKSFDTDGNLLATSDPLLFTVVEPPPVAVPAIHLPSTGLQADTPFDLSGTASPNSAVSLFDGDVLLGETSADADGNWQLTVPGLAAGEHSLVVKVPSTDGVLLSSPPRNVNIPAAAGAESPAPTISSPQSGSAVMAGTAVALAGTAAPGATVRLFDGDTLLGETTADADGNWSFELPALDLGPHSLVARVFDAEGKAVAVSEPLQIEAGAGEQVFIPIITTPGSGGAAPEGMSGTAEPGATIRIFDGETLLGETTTDAEGKWTFALPALPPGPHSLVARTFDADGKQTAESAPLDFTVPEAPATAAPTIASPLPGTTLAAGAPVQMAGSAAPGSTIRLFDGDILIGETSADDAGNWSFDLPALATGSHSLIARAFDASGNLTAESTPLDLNIAAATAETTPSIALPSPAALSGGAFTLRGVAAPGSVVRVFDGETLLGESVADADGNWALDVPALAPGEHSLFARVFSAAGEQTGESSPLAVNIPEAGAGAESGQPQIAQPPTGQRPAITPPDTDTALPVLEGVAPPGATVRIYDGDTLIGETTADAEGKWMFRPVQPLEAGGHNLTPVIVDENGEESEPGEPVTVDVPETPAETGGDTTPSAPETVLAAPEVSENSLPVLGGTAPPGATVRIYDGDVLLGETVADENGAWYFAPANPLSAGEHTLRAATVAADGSEISGPEFTLAIAEDAQPLNPPTIRVPAKGQISAGSRLRGTAPPNSTVQIYAGNRLLGSAVAGSGGNWGFVLPDDLPAGPYSLHVVALDADGNVISESAPIRVSALPPPQTLPVTGGHN